MKGIPFNDDMVRVILEGRKTQTRRPMKPQPELRDNRVLWEHRKGVGFSNCGEGSDYSLFLRGCPLGQAGDRLWVRETWGMDTEGNLHLRSTECESKVIGGWNPSIHMPRWASRITLEITEIRVQRVNDITDEDVLAEGCSKCKRTGADTEDCWMDTSALACGFSQVWDSLYAKKGLGWTENPWVWALTFRRIS